jgi:hypothetical protein
MKKPITLSLVLAGLAGFLAPRADASCAFLRGPRHIEADVVTCEAPRARAEAAFAKHRMAYPQSGDAPAGVLDNILRNAPPSQVVSLKVIRFQQLPKDAEGVQEDLAGVPWTVEKQPEMKEYLVTGVASCAEFPPGEKAHFFERFTCCDTLPYTDLQCLVGLPVLVKGEVDSAGSS